MIIKFIILVQFLKIFRKYITQFRVNFREGFVWRIGVKKSSDSSVIVINFFWLQSNKYIYPTNEIKKNGVYINIHNLIIFST